MLGVVVSQARMLVVSPSSRRSPAQVAPSASVSVAASCELLVDSVEHARTFSVASRRPFWRASEAVNL